MRASVKLNFLEKFIDSELINLNFLIASFIASSLLAFAGQVSASELKVMVSMNGLPVEDASVCVGTIQEPALFSHRLSDSQGQVKFRELPDGKLAITVEQNGFGRRAMRKSAFEQLMLIELSEKRGDLGCQEILEESSKWGPK